MQCIQVQIRISHIEYQVNALPKWMSTISLQHSDVNPRPVRCIDNFSRVKRPKSPECNWQSWYLLLIKKAVEQVDGMVVMAEQLGDLDVWKEGISRQDEMKVFPLFLIFRYGQKSRVTQDCHLRMWLCMCVMMAILFLIIQFPISLSTKKYNSCGSFSSG